MHYVYLALGSYGDVLPLIGLARQMRRAGHRTTVVAPPVFQDLAAYNDVEFVPVTSRERHAESVRDMYLLATRYSDLFIRRYAVEWNYSIYQYLKTLKGSDTIVIAGSRGFLWADTMACAHLDLSVFRAIIDPPGTGEFDKRNTWLPPGAAQDHLVRGYESEWSGLAARLGLPSGRGHLSRIRQRLGAGIPRFGLYPAWLDPSPVGRPFPRFGFGPQPLFPPDFGGPSPDFGAGRDLVVFVAGTLGMTASWEARLIAVGAETCRALNCNSLFLGGDGTSRKHSYAGTASSVEFVPLDRILTRAHAIVHHGGIGTAALALKHRVPQVVIPRVLTQSDNARMLSDAQVATCLAAERLTCTSLVNAIASACRLRPSTASQGGDSAIADELHHFVCKTIDRAGSVVK